MHISLDVIVTAAQGDNIRGDQGICETGKLFLFSTGETGFQAYVYTYLA